MFGFSVGRGVGLRVLPAWRAQGLSLIHATAAPRYRTAPGGRRPEPAAGESGVELKCGKGDNYLPWEPAAATGLGGADQPPSFQGLSQMSPPIACRRRD